MAWTNKDQMAYVARRRAEGTIKRVTIDLTPDTAQEWEAYADHLGVPRATMVRQCIARCMDADGWHDPCAVDGPESSGAGLIDALCNAQAVPRPDVITSEDAPSPKRKRGRPRKSD